MDYRMSFAVFTQLPLLVFVAVAFGQANRSVLDSGASILAPKLTALGQREHLIGWFAILTVEDAQWVPALFFRAQWIKTVLCRLSHWFDLVAIQTFQYASSVRNGGPYDRDEDYGLREDEERQSSSAMTPTGMRMKNKSVFKLHIFMGVKKINECATFSIWLSFTVYK